MAPFSTSLINSLNSGVFSTVAPLCTTSNDATISKGREATILSSWSRCRCKPILFSRLCSSVLTLAQVAASNGGAGVGVGVVRFAAVRGTIMT